MNSQQLQVFLNHLETVQRRPGMYIGPPNRYTISSYLTGFYKGLELGSFFFDQTPLIHIAQARGWKTDTSMGYWPDMDEKGLSEIDIVTEELAIHIEMWRQYIQEHLDNEVRTTR